MNRTKQRAKRQTRKGLGGKLLNLALAPFTIYGHGKPGAGNPRICIGCHKPVTGGTWRVDFSPASIVNGKPQRYGVISHGGCVPSGKNGKKPN